MIDAQVQSGITFGLTAALRGAITIKDGRVEQSNFDTYPPMRIDEVPRIETQMVPSRENPGASARRRTAIIAPAVTNAIFTASGRCIRKAAEEQAIAERGLK
ncbi:hypothetical protein IVB15_24765 [Bradyrhizobium sp. 182]|uniref:hypothetical protein n=1 Tax=unclassified Bradyrhizobium TaxID=2631580 RepID=UPI001FFB1065|nr:MULTISPECIES: hypothetical protein [unclassified Bradyrhizobium]MCK1419709.1 hypothetical protein [Bradyrhizobium sp. CW12]MCK1530834.1 hypothetical protein [Bradyrhizobium sp. 182]MCK1646362.1 hypothetical protein [Bradyrhizobium sp. 154]MCK1665695.1 hypothetical protein [Bradyrhizobium sp. 153]